MRWHAKHHIDEQKICHQLELEAWLHFNATHLDFAAETKNVRLGFCTKNVSPIQPFWKLEKVVFIMVSDFNALQPSSVDVHEDTVHVLDIHCAWA